MFFDYFLIFFFSLVALCLVFLMFLLPFFLAPSDFDDSKVSAYECGFEPFEDARLKFDVHFYIFAILFIIFDIEIIFLLPWVLYCFNLGIFAFINVLCFLLLLIIGFIYEWIRGGIQWIK